MMAQIPLPPTSLGADDPNLQCMTVSFASFNTLWLQLQSFCFPLLRTLLKKEVIIESANREGGKDARCRNVFLFKIAYLLLSDLWEAWKLCYRKDTGWECKIFCCSGSIWNPPLSSEFKEPQDAIKRKFLLSPDPAPPRSLFAVNKTQTSVTLLWVEEGVADFFEVFCQQAGLEQDIKNQVSSYW